MSSIKSMTCQIVSDLAKRDQKDFNHDIDYIDSELEGEIICLYHII